eukprot:CAMPEP_0119061056 /NCGR_PEP_ID=MMETSP1178-20130426/4921_1 /TAXON_ID=33656 /ORGANISM="unid sp, Strain CCMP2000" /LENGTH=112 /DNA_ID=CAMNT_0007042225 /DNA_START=288 /DNA_END=626 /DNA_ORIENTATION=-
MSTLQAQRWRGAATRGDRRHRHGPAVGGALANIDAHPSIALQRPAADAQRLRLSNESLSHHDSVFVHVGGATDGGAVITVVGDDTAATKRQLERRPASQIACHDCKCRGICQ